MARFEDPANQNSEPFTELSTSDFESGYAEAAAKVGRFNLAIFGKTGVGKSTLLNAIFGEDVARTGVGRPVTQNSQLYLHRSGTLGIYDTRGVEIGVDSAGVLADLRQIVESSRNRAEEDQIHVAWYCVRSSDSRFEDTEAAFIRELDRLGLPVMLILTQVGKRGDDYNPEHVELGTHIQSLRLPIFKSEIYAINAVPDPWLGSEVHGLADLLKATYAAAPEAVEAAIDAAQTIEIERKRNRAALQISAAVTAAAAAGAVPIPFSDAAVLVPIQTSMMGAIAITYKVRPDVSVATSLAVTSIASQAGRSAAAGLIKMIPGAGSVVGGAINASIAASFTYAMGMAWREVCEKMANGDFGESGTLDSSAIKQVFLAEFKTRGLRRLRSQDKQ
jgi:uncharacterized protein (DUF697 family)/GTPase SAR1 family protein